MANIMNSGQIVTALFPPPPKETDPRSDLVAYLETKENFLIQYSKKEGINKDYLERQISEYEHLQTICDKLTSLALYQAWRTIEEACHKFKDSGADSINIIIPLFENSKGVTPVYFNLCER